MSGCFQEILQQMQETHDRKKNDYAGDDPFWNFRESERLGIPAWKGALVRLSDKYTRIMNLAGGREQMVKDEAIEDTLLDAAIYSIIIICLRREADKVTAKPKLPEWNNAK
jgi:hypothetical protein